MHKSIEKLRITQVLNSEEIKFFTSQCLCVKKEERPETSLFVAPFSISSQLNVTDCLASKILFSFCIVFCDDKLNATYATLDS